MGRKNKKKSFSAFGKTYLAFVDDRLNLQGYQEILNKNLLPFLHSFPVANYTFMHENALVHASASTKD